MKWTIFPVFIPQHEQFRGGVKRVSLAWSHWRTNKEKLISRPQWIVLSTFLYNWVLVSVVTSKIYKGRLVLASALSVVRENVLSWYNGSENKINLLFYILSAKEVMSLSQPLGLHKEPKAISEFQNGVKCKTFSKSFSRQSLHTLPHFETEAQSNSEMAYRLLIWPLKKK